MPCIRSTSSGSLRLLALRNIAHHMEDYWLNDYAENFLNQGCFMFVIGPFECLTPCLIGELLDVLVDEGLLKRYYLHVLIDPRLTHLNLSKAKAVANKDSIVKLVETRCQRLTHLNIASLNKLSSRVIADLVTHLPLISHLNLSQTKTTDQVLSMIGNSCSSLVDVNLYGCPVTDMGLMSLCVSFNSHQQKCHKLLRLNVGCTSVTSKGIEVVLNNVPLIEHLMYQDICDVLYQMHWSDCSTTTPVPQDKQYALRCLYRSHLKPSLIPVSESIRVSVAFCPSVTEIYFTQGATNQCLLLLMSLRLRVLSVANSEEEAVTFEGGLFPLLQTSGQNLQELALFEINQVDIGAVALCCPQLRKFSCLVAGYEEALFPVNSHPELITPLKPKTFSQLEQVRVLLHTTNNSFPPQFIRTLFKDSTKLKTLHLAFVHAFSDTLFNEIIQHNELSCIEKIILESCHEISDESVYQLLNMRNNLQELCLNGCQLIARRDYDKYTRLVKEKNYSLKIQWE